MRASNDGMPRPPPPPGPFRRMRTQRYASQRLTSERAPAKPSEVGSDMTRVRWERDASLPACMAGQAILEGTCHLNARQADAGNFRPSCLRFALAAIAVYEQSGRLRRNVGTN